MIKAPKQLIEIALAEDLGPGDITTENLIPVDQQGRGEIVAKEPLIVAGLGVAAQVFKTLDSDVMFTPLAEDGDSMAPGQLAAEISGRTRTILMCERAALNFLQRLSGIATHARKYSDQLSGKKVRLVDTRKTTPGWRVLEKYAVKIGGCGNHRMGLFDGVLIKDNHIAAAGGIKRAVDIIKARVHHLVKIEVETENIGEVRDAIDAGADVIMLDNMDIGQVRAAVELIDGSALVEVSGMVTLERIEELEAAGVDIISVGALTHSARAVDISMRIK